MLRGSSVTVGLFLVASAFPGCGSNGAGSSGPASSPDASTSADVSMSGDTSMSADTSANGDAPPGEAGPDASTGDASAPRDGSVPGDAANLDASSTGDALPTTCTGGRPQLSDTEAATDTVLGYLAQAGILSAGLLTDNWDPTAGLGDVTTFTPTYRVAATGGTQTTVQAAVDAAVAAGGTSRIYISVARGTYAETVCVPSGAPPITLYGTGTDPSQTTIAYGNFNGEAPDAAALVNRCTPPSGATLGTAGSATFVAFAQDFQAKNITFSNNVTSATLGSTSGTQAVALMTQADRIVLDSVRVLGHQDTLYLETSGAGTVVRAYVKNSTIVGDVDFIFGGATFVLDGCTIQFVSDRKANGQVLAPDTNSRNPFGALVNATTFTADANTAAGVVGLGRAWDRSCVDLPTYVSTCVASGSYPNGQAVIRNSTLGAHIASAPWFAAATTKRPYCDTAWQCEPDGGTCPANRLFEYKNTGPGAAP
jgi:pectinesterase